MTTTTTGHKWMSATMSTFDAPLASDLCGTLLFGLRKHPISQNNTPHLACEVLTGSFGAVSPPMR